jgi:hypothetical protein
MVKLSFSPSFIKDSLSVFRQRGLKGLIFGTSGELSPDEAGLLASLHDDFQSHSREGARRGSLGRIDAIHKGKGSVFLVADPNSDGSLLLFDKDTRITNGPDLWVYLSDSTDPRQGLGDYHDLGLLAGNKGGQAYHINKSIEQLQDCRTVIIHCKQFDVLFSYARLE